MPLRVKGKPRSGAVHAEDTHIGQTFKAACPPPAGFIVSGWCICGGFNPGPGCAWGKVSGLACGLEKLI